MTDEMQTALKSLKFKEDRLVLDLNAAEQKATDLRNQLCGLRDAIAIVEGKSPPVTRAI